MQEDFIHYLWKHKKFSISQLETKKGQVVEVVSTGEHNLNSGPDFFNAQIKIDNQLWAGNVEIHLRSSDWFVHNHETDSAYDNVILHVVWEHDTEIFRKDNSEIETLELRHCVSKEALNNYQKLFNKQQKWINCENDFASVDEFLLSNWLERLYFERLERKSNDINELLKTSKNNWEAVLFKMLTKNFGLKVNGDAFLSVANSIEFSIIRKEQSKLGNLEALLFGQAGLFVGDKEDKYFNELKDIYGYQKHKYHLSNLSVSPLQFFRLRPPNFPTVRLSQLASLFHFNEHLFSKIIYANSKEEIYKMFSVKASEYWDTHYTFDKVSKKSKKQVSSSFINLLLINTIIPLKFSYAQYIGKPINEEIVHWMSQLKSEQNGIVDKFNSMKPIFCNALNSQALIQLKTNYCNKNKCLQCAIGSEVLSD